jgi:NADH:ubiquinone oxidoreductase subunit 3 (subunit A)
MNRSILLFPPLAFGIYLLVIWTVSRFTSGMAAKHTDAEGKELPYACGEEFPGEKATPDYGSFFPFAIFFTMMHVAGLMLATFALAPSGILPLGAGAAYLVAIGIILAILFLG